MNEWLKEMYELDRKKKEAMLKENPELANDSDFWDSHCCSWFDDGYGYCDWCGAIIYGTSAYYSEYGCDPSDNDIFDDRYYASED